MDTGTDATDVGTAHALQAALDALPTGGGRRSDAVRLHYIQSLLARCDQGDANVTQFLLQKAWAALHSYRADLDTAAVRAATPPPSTNTPATRSALALLIEQLDGGESPADNQTSAAPADHQPAPSTEDVGSAHVDDIAPRDDRTQPTGGLRELKAASLFRDTLQQQRADTLLSRAIIDAPEYSGPLNPQRLALRSMAIMRDLSPAYLGHFVSYFDTLLWLETIDQSGKSK